jgi:phosphoglycerate dehydrogenase-like enzyme
MHSTFVLVIGDPSAPFLTLLSQTPFDVRCVISNRLAELKRHALDADAILFADFDSDLLAKTLPSAPQVRWIHSLWTGVEGMLKPELLNHPATLTNGRGVFRRPLADWVVASMLYFAFDLRRVIDQQEHGIWQPFVSSTLAGRTLGIIGYGAVGSAAAGRARAFGMKIAALRRRRELFQADALVDRSYGSKELGELMAASDYVLVATPLTPETRGMIGETQIATMKPTGILINVGRGPVIDEAALIRALESGRIRGAALDVFTTEPLPPSHPFWKMKSVLLSPHTADRVEGFLEPAFECFFDNLERFRKNLPLLNIVDKQAGY